MRFLSIRAIAVACLASLAMASSTNAAAILQFQQQNSTLSPIVATDTGASTTIATTGAGVVGNNPPGWVPVFVSILGSPIAQPAFMSFTTALTSSSPATGGTSISQGGYTGTIQFNLAPAPTAATNILTVTFTGGLLSGNAGGTSAGFSSAQPPSSVTFTSANPLLAAEIAASVGRDFALGFSGLSSPLALSGTTIDGFTASAAGTFSTFIPEPSSVVMASLSALAGLGCFARRRFMASRA
jgi:hypothetical protein